MDTSSTTGAGCRDHLLSRNGTGLQPELLRANLLIAPSDLLRPCHRERHSSIRGLAGLHPELATQGAADPETKGSPLETQDPPPPKERRDQA